MIANSEDNISILHDMLRIRRFEEACAEQYTAGLIRGFLHLYIGEEAVAVGVMRQLTPEDSIFATYREHGHALIRGTPARTIMAEMFGKLEGCCRGRGGSMHLFDRERHLYGGNAIVAGALPLAVGMGLAAKMQNRRDLAVCFFGEGAIAEGEFHESMNLAELWRLPVLFLCENNFYAMGTALDRSESETDLVKKAASYRVRSSSVDGMDVLAVQNATREAIQSIKEHGEPYFLECKTYRFRAHSMFDAELYRDKDEVAHWKERDPITLFQTWLKQEGLLTDDVLDDLKQKVEAEIQDAVNFAKQGSEEPTTELMRFIYCEEPTEGRQLSWKP
jgi:pyruvate dehydrogenase E1 component alpha subunit